MSIDLTSNFIRLLLHFRRQDLVTFGEEHDRLYLDAKKTSDHLAVTSHYYSVMSTVIEEYFNGSFHFVPPEYDGQTLEEALYALHQRIAECLKLEKGKRCVDIGCGIGSVMRDVADSGGELVGVTIAANEAVIGNERFRAEGLTNCRIVEGDCHAMPLQDADFDAAFAVYALKYFVDLGPVLREVHRVLRPGGLFVVYDLLKTADYDESKAEHRAVIEGLEYACGMPSLHTREEMIEKASESGLELIDSIDLAHETGNPYHYCFSNSSFFMWLTRSSFIGFLISAAQAVGILPKGFSNFNNVFLSGTVSKIVRGGQMGILSGCEILLFKKK